MPESSLSRKLHRRRPCPHARASGNPREPMRQWDSRHAGIHAGSVVPSKDEQATRQSGLAPRSGIPSACGQPRGDVGQQLLVRFLPGQEIEVSAPPLPAGNGCRRPVLQRDRRARAEQPGRRAHKRSTPASPGRPGCTGSRRSSRPLARRTSCPGKRHGRAHETSPRGIRAGIVGPARTVPCALRLTRSPCPPADSGTPPRTSPSARPPQSLRTRADPERCPGRRRAVRRRKRVPSSRRHPRGTRTPPGSTGRPAPRTLSGCRMQYSRASSPPWK